ncbi:hypothetical protein VP1G_01732 [Cytospora mali]|uniref:Pentatricopeptide repeat-containing protein, mitochondrial n=1 Tax=Cytospora mali TaxID=578113 RepID=A0A194URU8_CYTMA|nr:hypothetical protein VP1G_01732 [Valsa mali var. pyri (nom. inval.)]
MICFACRSRLLATASHRARAPRLPRWRTQANLSSATAGAPVSDRTNDDYVPSIDVPEYGDTQNPGRDPPQQYEGPPEPRFSALQRRRLIRSRRDDSKENSLEIFEKVVRKQIDQDDAAADEPIKSPAPLEFYNNLSQLRPMMRTESIETCLEFFFNKIWDNCPFEKRPLLLKQRGTFLMRKVVEAKLDDFDNERLPSIARCTQIFHNLESLSSTKWADAVMGLILNIDSRSGGARDNKGAGAHREALARKEALLHDLVDSWIVYHRYCLLLPNNSQFRFPRINEKRLWEYAKNGEIRKAMRLMFPQARNNAFRELPAVAIASFVVLTDPLHTNLDIQQKARPLLQPIGKILATIPVWKDGLEYIFAGYTEALAYILRRWDSVISQLRQTDSSPGQSDTQTVTRRPVSAGYAGPQSRVIQDRVTAALKMGDVEAVEAAWARFGATEAKPGDDRAKELQGSQELFHYFLTAFTALHRPRRAVDVWDSMVRIGIKPTLQSWTALIEGCRRSRNAIGLENVWKKLLITGAELDDAVWSARIVGLVDCGQPEAGLRALDEMLRLSKFKPDSPAVSKLTRKVASVNAAVSALIRLNAMSAAMKVLTWAAENGIEPDVYTYNTLLRPMVYQGSAQQVDTLLKMMKQQGIQPDTATFTVLLDGLIGNVKDAGPDEQVKTAIKLFSMMEAAGVHANMETIARMLHLLLRDSGAKASAVIDAIRGYIRERGLRDSPYIYTILMDHYFAQSPPDLAAVDALLEEGGFKMENGRLRLQGYAMAGQVDKAFGLFEETNNLGSALTMDTLEILLRALTRAGMFDEARRMVEIVIAHRQASDMYGAAGPGEVDNGDEQSRLRGRYWRHAFWAVALDCGLVSPARIRQLEMGIRAADAAPAPVKAS